LVFGPNNDGILRIALSDAIFNVGLFGLGSCGAVVDATFTLAAEPTQAVPEPSSTMVWGGLGLLSVVVVSAKRRFRGTAT
jgi:hypothetical protein